LTVGPVQDKYKLNLEQLKEDIQNLSLNVVVASNREPRISRNLRNSFPLCRVLMPTARNPTGQTIAGKDLEDLVHLSRDKTTIILDEFYSWQVIPPSYTESTTVLCSTRYRADWLTGTSIPKMTRILV
jgi:aspartate/methionine/tyrosine aminotransferase